MSKLYTAIIIMKTKHDDDDKDNNCDDMHSTRLFKKKFRHNQQTLYKFCHFFLMVQQKYCEKNLKKNLNPGKKQTYNNNVPLTYIILIFNIIIFLIIVIMLNIILLQIKNHSLIKCVILLRVVRVCGINVCINMRAYRICCKLHSQLLQQQM